VVGHQIEAAIDKFLSRIASEGGVLKKRELEEIKVCKKGMANQPEEHR
jgi:hypothetical protein